MKGIPQEAFDELTDNLEVELQKNFRTLGGGFLPGACRVNSRPPFWGFLRMVPGEIPVTRWTVFEGLPAGFRDCDLLAFMKHAECRR